jgi:gamma-glutamylcyclotransferase (GGCT)/AIG2-like uncharacterized protein YtfP
MEQLFCYGTLMCPTVYKAVTGQSFTNARSAVLSSFEIYSLHHRVYPGIIPAAGCQVKGLMVDITPSLLLLLDAFEGDEYTREKVKIDSQYTPSGHAWSYILKSNRHHLLSHKGWDFARFLKEDLPNYLDD